VEDSALRNRLSVLWLSGAVTSVASVVLEILSGKKEGFMADPATLLVLETLSVVGPIMAFLSQVLNGRTNRWVNVIMGVIVEAFGVIILLGESASNPVLTIDPAVGLVFLTLIIWYAWKSEVKVDSAT
jgi:hypothetical protein